MRPWIIILGGLIVWAAHFAALYAIGSVLPGQAAARWLVVAATATALAADAAVWIKAGRVQGDALEDWIGSIGRIGAAVSALAVIWQTVPAVLA